MAETPENNEPKEKFSKDTKFFRSPHIVGLSVQYGDTPGPGEQQQVMTFQPRKFFDERTREHYVEGFLATDESDVCEVLADDINVVEISKEEYEKAMKDGVPA